MEIATHSCVTAIPMEDSFENFRDRFLFLWAKATPLVFLAVSTVTFNLTVLWMFKVKRSLRSCKNIYLASLAMADLLIGLCQFLAIFQQLKTQVDWLPLSWCRLYLILRHSALYISLLSLVLITGDRWWSIHYPFSYRARRRKRYAFTAVTCVWVFGFILHIMPVTLWEDDLSGNSTVIEGDVFQQSTATSCELPFSHSTLFMSTVSVVQYFIPLMAMLSLNFSLYVGILQRKRIQVRRSVSVSDKMNVNERRGSISSVYDCNFLAQETIHLLNGPCPAKRGPLRIIPLRRNSADVVLLRSSVSSPLFGNGNPRQGSRPRRFSWAPRNNFSRPIKCGEELAKSLLIKQDRRAAFWLGLLVFVFLLCWLPHTVVGILQSTRTIKVPRWTKDLTLWFLLINSAVNPLLYGFFNREIRRAFKHWLCGEVSQKWRVKNALALYGVGLTTAVAVPKRMSSFEAVPE